MSLYRGDEVSGTGTSVEDLIAGKVNRTGDTMTGALAVPAGATGSQVPRRSEVDTAISTATSALLNNTALTGSTTAQGIAVGDTGVEGSGINIGGVTYESTFKVSDINGTNYAQTILHRHSTTLQPLIVGARSNSDVSTHTNVTNGQSIFSVYAAGYAGSNYKLFGSLNFGVDSTGTVSNTSAPGKFFIQVTPDASVTPVTVLSIDNAGVTTATIKNTPAGNIAATTVQAAINELDTEKAKLAGDSAQIFSVANGTTTYEAVNYGQLSAVSAATVLRNYLSGATMSTAGSSTTMSIAAGQAADSTNTNLMSLSAISKTTSAWAVGTGNGGLDTGSLLSSAFGATCSYATTVMTCTVAPTSGNFAVGQYITGNGIPAGTYISSLGTGTGGTGTYNLSTTPGTISAQTTNGLSWYNFYIIRRPDTGVVDVIFSASSTSPTLPTNYTQYRYIGAALINGSAQWVKFRQLGRNFEWDVPILDLSTVAGSSTATLAVVSVPRGRKMIAHFNVVESASAVCTLFSDPDGTDSAASTTAAPLFSSGAASTNPGGSQVKCWVTTSAQLRHREVLSSGTFNSATIGWIDLADTQ